MNEAILVVNRHFVIPLSDEEHKAIKQGALDADISQMDWLRQAVLEKLDGQIKKED